MKHWRQQRANLILILATLIMAMAVIGGCILGPVVAEPATPTPSPDYTVYVEPLAAAPGDPITVKGAGWESSGEILIGLSDPQSGAPAPVVRRAYAATEIDESGAFTIGLTLPISEAWTDQPTVLVIAWNPTTGQETSTELWLLQRQPGGNTATPTGTITETTTDTPTSSPTATSPTATNTPTNRPTTQPGQPTATPTATATRDPFTAFVTSDALNLRHGPGTNYEVILAVRRNTRLAVLGQNDGGDWLKVQITSGDAYGEVGWLARSFTDYRLNAPIIVIPSSPTTSTPTSTPRSTSTPTQVSTVDWRAEYYSNKNLSGNPNLIRSDAQINFDWGSGAPSASLPTDNFSARWTQTIYLSGDTYTFHVLADDGVRVWIGNDLIVDQWHDASATLYTVERRLNSGNYPIRVEYYEGTGKAQIQFWWNRGTTANQWRGEYFTNVSLAGSPTLVRNDAQIDFDWGMGSPAPGISADNFSARWTQTYTFEEGSYRFHALMDDGMRVYLDNSLLFDEWRDGSQREVVFEGRLSAGPHTLRVEYYERMGNAFSRFWWEKIANYPDWKGEYWSNTNQTGNPVLVRNDVQVDFNWGLSSPSGLPADGFSARWTRTLNFEAATYRFNVEVDDAARVWVDGALLLDAWQDGPQRRVSAEAPVTAGNHSIRVDYYERSGGASIKFWTEKIGATPTATPSPSVTLTPTATATATSGSPVPLPSLVPTQTSTGTPTATATSTPTHESTTTFTVTATPTNDTSTETTRTPVPIESVVPTATATDEPTLTPTVTETPTADTAAESTQTPVVLETILPTATEPPTATPTEEPTATETATPELVKPQPAPTDIPTPEIGANYNGIVNGEVCRPESAEESMVLYFGEIDTGSVLTLPVKVGQTRYTISLPPGTYLAYGWLNNGAAGVAYTEAVVCGLGDACTLHSLTPFSVTAGSSINGIDICDWNGVGVPAPPPLVSNR